MAGGDGYTEMGYTTSGHKPSHPYLCPIRQAGYDDGG